MTYMSSTLNGTCLGQMRTQIDFLATQFSFPRNIMILTVSHVPRVVFAYLLDLKDINGAGFSLLSHSLRQFSLLEELWSILVILGWITR